MNLCNGPYSIPKICEQVGNTKLQEFIYVTDDGMPINITTATISWTLELQATGDTIQTKSVIGAVNNTCTVLLDTQGLDGTYVQKIEVTMPSGDRYSDRGIVIVYG
ncbi:MAG: hypothetical protein ACRDD8_02340 [Bacteroidales bacterium]